VYLLKTGVLRFDTDLANGLKGIAWKDVNTKFKNDFTETEKYAREYFSSSQGDLTRLDKYLKELESQVKTFDPPRRINKWKQTFYQ